MTYITEKATLYLNNDYKIKKRGDNLILYKNNEKLIIDDTGGANG